MANPKKTKRNPVPIDAAFSGTQLSLFQSFLCNTDEERDQLSNTVELWDSIPKYAVSQQAMNKVRTKDGYLPRQEKEFFYRDHPYKVKISAAIVDEDKGGEKAYYPSANEELVEDALRKIAAEQYKGFFDKPAFRSGVVFSINRLRQELKRRGHARSYQEIVRSLNILAGSSIEISLPGGKGFARTNYLPMLAAVSRTQLDQDPSAKWVAHFHPLVTESIDKLSYRQYNFHLMMSHSSQLARWLHKRLSHNYVNASYTTPYNILLSTIRRDSGLLEYKRTNDMVRKLEDAFSELIEHEVMLTFEKEESRGARNKILDIKYSFTPHPEFVKDVKAANKRQRDSRETAKTVVGIGRSSQPTLVGIGRN